MEVFKRYNTVSRDELKALVNGKTEWIFTYIFTKKNGLTNKG